MFGNRLINTNAGGGGCTDTVDLYNPFPDGGGVALYQLNGDATDVSGNYDGTATSVTYGAGEFGQAGVFNGSSSLISAPNNSLLTQTQFSVSAWVNHNSATGYRTIISNYGYTAANGESGWIIALNAGKVRVFNIVSGASYFVDSIASIPGGVFTNVAVTNTQSQVNIYINGFLDSTHSMSGFVFNLAINNYLTIGAYKYDAAGSPNGKFSGSIDQVRIFSRALRPYEVEALYTEEYCTPTIVPSEHFNTVLYEGNNSTNPRTGVGFQPDFVWIKNRDISTNHALYDSVRGINKRLVPSGTNAEISNSSFASFDSDGFTLTSTDTSSNQIPYNYVAWNFKAGGAAVTNTDGTITSQVSANTEAGFSIVSYTGNGANGTVGHGLGTTPNIVLSKRRTGGTSAWSFNGNVGGLIYGSNKLTLETTNAIVSDTNEILAANSNNFTAGTSTAAGASGSTYIAYCFAEVEGFSSFGSYVGTGASGNTVVTGFEPAFVMIKRTEGPSSWYILDNKRDTTNPRDLSLSPDLSSAEGNIANFINFYDNGFSLAGTAANGTGQKWIYMAFAADPTTIEPSLEDSFNTVLYTGNGGTQSVTGVGFQPDLVWAKGRSVPYSNVLTDSVRGAGAHSLFSDLTIAEDTSTSYLSSFNTDGFTLTSQNGLNQNGATYVSWNWKGAELPAINSNGSIPSVVSANPAAGFSIVSFTSNGAAGTLGHGLDVAPDVVIWKNRSASETWWFQHTILDGSDDYLKLNETVFNQNVSAGWVNSLTSTTIKDFTAATNGQNVIAYCFAEVAGFSKFGSYAGTGSAGNTVTLGFEPAFVMVKRTDATGGWLMADNKRDTTNPITGFLSADTSQAEFTISNGIDFNANDFTIDSTNGSFNASGGTYIYMAFANQF